MNTKHYTSIEQSKKLLELGLSPESADMLWYLVTLNEPATLMVKCWAGSLQWQENDLVLPCWSLGALLEVMPKTIRIVNTYYGYELYASAKGYAIDYIDVKRLRKLHSCDEESMIEAAYNMVVWLLENNYIKKGE